MFEAIKNTENLSAGSFTPFNSYELCTNGEHDVNNGFVFMFKEDGTVETWTDLSVNEEF
jgi:hypothetical protein